MPLIIVDDDPPNSPKPLDIAVFFTSSGEKHDERRGEQSKKSNQSTIVSTSSK